MLTILEKNELVNVLVVVTRYFGGILLGTGGLVRAYSNVTMLALENTQILNICEGYRVSIKVNYEELEKIKYFCKSNNIIIKKEEFLEIINLILEIEKNKLEIVKDFCNKNIQNDEINILANIYIKN